MGDNGIRKRDYVVINFAESPKKAIKVKKILPIYLQCNLGLHDGNAILNCIIAILNCA